MAAAMIGPVNGNEERMTAAMIGPVRLGRECPVDPQRIDGERRGRAGRWSIPQRRSSRSTANILDMGGGQNE